MKLIIAIIRGEDQEAVSHALTKADFRVTYIASTGGFLRRGTSTLLIGLQDEQVEEALELIRANVSPSSEPSAKNATIFVVKVDHYTQL
jgi:uncharacterized protein YaaQ